MIHCASVSEDTIEVVRHQDLLSVVSTVHFDGRNAHHIDLTPEDAVTLAEELTTLSQLDYRVVSSTVPVVLDVEPIVTRLVDADYCSLNEMKNVYKDILVSACQDAKLWGPEILTSTAPGFLYPTVEKGTFLENPRMFDGVTEETEIIQIWNDDSYGIRKLRDIPEHWFSPEEEMKGWAFVDTNTAPSEYFHWRREMVTTRWDDAKIPHQWCAAYQGTDVWDVVNFGNADDRQEYIKEIHLNGVTALYPIPVPNE